MQERLGSEEKKPFWNKKFTRAAILVVAGVVGIGVVVAAAG